MGTAEDRSADFQTMADNWQLPWTPACRMNADGTFVAVESVTFARQGNIERQTVLVSTEVATARRVSPRSALNRIRLPPGKSIIAVPRILSDGAAIAGIAGS
jgi:hypothetical protein